MNEQKNTTKTQIKQAAIRQIEKFGIGSERGSADGSDIRSDGF